LGHKLLTLPSLCFCNTVYKGDVVMREYLINCYSVTSVNLSSSVGFLTYSLLNMNYLEVKIETGRELETVEDQAL